MEDQQILNSTKNHFLLFFGFWVNGSGDVWLSLSFTLMIWKLDKRGVLGIWDYGGSGLNPRRISEICVKKKISWDDKKRKS